MMCELLKQQSSLGFDVNVLEGIVIDYHDLRVAFNGVMEKVDGRFKVHKVGKEYGQRACQKLQPAIYLF